ncbi:hypothetical protein [Flavobacterium silvaticum]|uniref:BZIP transcription factor n=1 Tax=Flavobacterium silvaticum TaxID=1852020 RepID=A0A972FK79_9FLAO|nr:hypothetical protein [Flavobacterium silvaticum]NMH26740.1 hypothetical protein [Flavobacterium silvaticum]
MKKRLKFGIMAVLASFSLQSQTLKATASGSVVTNSTAGNNSTFVGTSAGAVTTGASNTFVGYQAGSSNTTGLGNTMLGTNAGSYNITGISNTFIGNGAGYNNTGSYNTLIGTACGSNTTSGGGNSFLGHGAGDANTTGTNNTYLGFLAGNTATGSYNIFVGQGAGKSGSGNDLLFVDNSNTQNPLIWGSFVNGSRQLKFHGKVGIGGEYNTAFGSFPTTAGGVSVANYKLFVKGGILTEEVRVNTVSGWADYVFKDDYHLRPLSEVEQFITDNGHLPNVPSACEVESDGIELANMAKIQQEKIEELTLYLIQQQKEIETLKAQMNLLLEKKQ